MHGMRRRIVRSLHDGTAVRPAAASCAARAGMPAPCEIWGRPAAARPAILAGSPSRAACQVQKGPDEAAAAYASASPVLPVRNLVVPHL